MIETITFLGSASTFGAKVHGPTPDDTRAYSTGPGPFVVRRIAVADLDALASLVGNCPANAFVVRGDPDPIDASSIPYRRHRAQDGAPASLQPRAHQWIAIDFDEKDPPSGTPPRPDLRAAATEARSRLPPAFHGVRAFAMATSSAGIVPGIRVRLWFWCSRAVGDSEAKAWLGSTRSADLGIYSPSQPCYCAAPRFEGRADPLAGLPRALFLDGDPLVQVPDTFEAPLKDFGPMAAGAVPGNRNVNLTSLAGSMRHRGLGEDAILAALVAHNAALASPLPRAELETIARSVSRYVPGVADDPGVPGADSGSTAGPPPTPRKVARAEKALRNVCDRIVDDPAHWQAHAAALGPYLENLPGDLAAVRIEKILAAGGSAIERAAIDTVLAAAAPAGSRTHAWAENAIVNDEGALVPCAENLSLLLRGHEQFQLWMNTRAGRPYWQACPWRQGGIAVRDGDEFQMRCWLSRTLGWHKVPCDLLPAFAEVASARPWDPWQGFLEGLIWDGERRLETAAIRLLGAQDSEANRTIFAWWMISSVARTFVPGCQADHMLVLEGEQGEGKTTFLRTLAMHEAFFTRLGASADLGGVRTIGKIHGPVIVEIAELDTVRKSTVEAVKMFVDERIDRVQWLYARSPVDVPRTCIFAGTSNDSEYLRDVTGNRRFWPLATGKIDHAATLAEREQLWAEAVALYRAGARWWPTKNEVRSLGLTEIQESRRVTSGIEDRLREVFDAVYAPGRHALTGVEIVPEQIVDGRLQWLTTAQACTFADAKEYDVQLALRAMKWFPQRVRRLTGQRIRAFVRPEQEAGA